MCGVASARFVHLTAASVWPVFSAACGPVACRRDGEVATAQAQVEGLRQQVAALEGERAAQAAKLDAELQAARRQVQVRPGRPPCTSPATSLGSWQ